MMRDDSGEDDGNEKGILSDARGKHARARERERASTRAYNTTREFQNTRR